MPIVVLIVFLVLGFIFQVWHPTWLVFLLVPITKILLRPYHKRKLSALAPFIAVIIFILIGTFVKNGYYYSWLIFLIIPLIGALES